MTRSLSCPTQPYGLDFQSLCKQDDLKASVFETRMPKNDESWAQAKNEVRCEPMHCVSVSKPANLLRP